MQRIDRKESKQKQFNLTAAAPSTRLLQQRASGNAAWQLRAVLQHARSTVSPHLAATGRQGRRRLRHTARLG